MIFVIFHIQNSKCFVNYFYWWFILF